MVGVNNMKDTDIVAINIAHYSNNHRTTFIKHKINTASFAAYFVHHKIHVKRSYLGFYCQDVETLLICTWLYLDITIFKICLI